MTMQHHEDRKSSFNTVNIIKKPQIRYMYRVKCLCKERVGDCGYSCYVSLFPVSPCLMKQATHNFTIVIIFICLFIQVLKYTVAPLLSDPSQ